MSGHREVPEPDLMENKKYKAYFDFADDAIFLMKEDLFTDCNKSALLMFGCSREDIVGQPPYRFSPSVQPDGRNSKEKAQEIINAALTGVPQHFEWKHKRLEGTLFDAEVSLNRIDMPSGYQIYASVRDITDRKKIEQLLMAEERFSETIMASTPGVFFILDKDGFFVRWNINEEEVTGYSVEDMRKVTYPDTVSEDDRGLAKSMVHDVIINGKTVTAEIYMVSKSGVRAPYLVTGVPVTIGNKVFMVAMGLDITKQKTVEVLLKENRKKLAEITDAIPGMVYEFKLDAGGTMSFVFASAGARQLSGLTPDEVMKNFSSMWNLVEAEDRDPLMRSILNSRQCKSPWRFEFRIRLRDGCLKWIRGESSIVRILGDGSFIWDGVLFDITAHKASDEALAVAYEKLKEAQDSLVQSEKLAALGRLSVGIAHEVKNPLGIVLGGAEFLESALKPLGAENKDVITRIKDAALRIDAILKNVLYYARSSSAQAERVGLNDSVQAAVSFFKYKAVSVNIDIVAELPAEDIFINGDKGQIYQVIYNIIKNAVEAMPSGGVVTVKTGIENSKACIDITDTGSGMSKEDLSRIFEPFYTTKRPKGGMGLGMFATKAIVERHGGEVVVSSEVGKGTDVKVILPLACSAEGM